MAGGDGRHLNTSGGVVSRGQITRLGLQPLADVTGAPLAIVRPSHWEAIVHHVVGLDAERVSNDLGGSVRVVAVDRLRLRRLVGGSPQDAPRRASGGRWCVLGGRP
jgi:hypothetical protein